MRLSVLLTRLTLLITSVVVVVACQGPPPTEYVIITSTPEGSLTPTPTITPAVTVIVITATPEAGSPTVEPSNSPEPTLTEVVVEMPTATLIQIQVAEQRFEKGRMFWLEPIDQIWVMIESDSDKDSGIWMIFNDEFEEGDVEYDPKIVPPEGLLQPERGFGKLWRDNPEVREGLGWAKQAEIGFVSQYQYFPAGEIVDGEYLQDPGYHLLTSGVNANRTYRFNEVNGTWQTLRLDP